MKVTRYYDERTNYFKSTHAASRYLTNLFSIYGDWLLVIAAYNGGTGNVDHAIKKSGSKDFWALQDYLPAESRNHVKKFIATHYIMEKQGGITTATKDEIGQRLMVVNSPKDVPGTVLQSISGRYNSLVIVKQLAMDIVLFNALNPDFDKQIALNGKFELRLPADKMDLFNAKKYTILDVSMQLILKPAGGKAPPAHRHSLTLEYVASSTRLSATVLKLRAWPGGGQVLTMFGAGNQPARRIVRSEEGKAGKTGRSEAPPSERLTPRRRTTFNCCTSFFAGA